jgi:hypothetical protein
VIIGTSASDCVLSSQPRSNVISRHSESAVDMLVNTRGTGQFRRCGTPMTRRVTWTSTT